MVEANEPQKTELLYLMNHYLKEFDATILETEEKKIVLDKTAFYPTGGGQPHDTGKIFFDKEEYNVVNGYKDKDGRVIYEVDREGLKVGDKVHCIINWERRYKLMRMHTACHVLAAVINHSTSALITGGQIDIEKSRLDFDLENFDKERISDYFEKANEVIIQNLPVRVIFVSRQKAIEDPSLFKLKHVEPKQFETLRIVEIGEYGGFDKQADGGTHIKSTTEIGKLEFLKAENKGKNNRRIYFTLTD